MDLLSLPSFFSLALKCEGRAVGALRLGRIALVGNYLDPGKRAVVLVFAVMSALLNGASDRLVSNAAGVASAVVFVFHNFRLLYKRNSGLPVIILRRVFYFIQINSFRLTTR